DGARIHGTLLGNAIGAEDALASGVIVNVAHDGSVVLVDGRLVELHARLLFDPRFELRVSRFAVGDEFLNRVSVEAEGTNSHHVVALADAGVTVGEFAPRFEGDFKPKPREMNRTQRTCHTGTYQRNSFAHSL